VNYPFKVTMKSQLQFLLLLFCFFGGGFYGKLQ